MNRTMLVLCAAAAVSGCVSAGADVSYWQPDLSAVVSVTDGGLAGTPVDLQGDLAASEEAVAAQDLRRLWHGRAFRGKPFGRL